MSLLNCNLLEGKLLIGAQDFWRMTASTSLALQALITRYGSLVLGQFDGIAAKVGSNPGELSSPRVDMIRRAFWHCSILET